MASKNTIYESDNYVNKYKYLFSVIISVYNVDQYIREALDSLVNQTIGFDKLQIILVDDGSIDESGKICDEYQAKYSSNVTVIHKSNEGLAKARLTGLGLAQGKYVNFFDPDDILDLDAFEKVFKFFEENYDKTDIVTIPLIFFGDQVGPHVLHYKFNKGDRVIDLTKEPDSVLLSLAASFIKLEEAQQITADSQLAGEEDAKEVIKVLLNKKSMGVVASTTYHYRRRKSSSSAGNSHKKNWYTYHLDNYCVNALELSRAYTNDGSIPKFIQYMIMYSLQWKFKMSKVYDNILTDEENQEYIYKLFNILKMIDSDVIIAQRQLSDFMKMFLLYKKYNKAAKLIFNYAKQGYLCCGDYLVYGLSNFSHYIDFIEINNNSLHIVGRQVFPLVGIPLPVSIKLISSQGEIYNATIKQVEEYWSCVEQHYAKLIHYEVFIPLSDKKSSFKIAYELEEGNQIYPRRFEFGQYSPITNNVKDSYYITNGYCIQWRREAFLIKKQEFPYAIKRELAFAWGIIKNKKAKSLSILLTRWLALFLKCFIKAFYKKEIWLFIEKAERAGDNAEALLQWMFDNNKTQEKKCIFIINKNSVDYKRVNKICTCVRYMSKLHKILFCIADRTISSYTHMEISNPFGKKSIFFSNIFQQNKICFLQHGITQHDVSSGLRVNNRNYSLFVTVTNKEKDSIVYGNYGYREDQVVLTGFPRFDFLTSNPQKVITIMPTWRDQLVGPRNAKTCLYEPLPSFKHSDYYKNFLSLLGDADFVSAVELKGYKFKFLPHPVFYIYKDQFEFDSRVEIYPESTTYRKIYEISSLVITDFSSAAFDFAYLKKPVIYFQFDKIHYQAGYFDYERDGLGEVEHSVENLKKRIFEYIDTECVLKPFYQRRIDEFFVYNDKNNSKRVFEAITRL